MLVIFEMFLYASIFKLYYHIWMKNHEYGVPFIDVEIGDVVDQGTEAVEMKERSPEEREKEVEVVKEGENEGQKEEPKEEEKTEKIETNGAVSNEAHDGDNVA